MEKDELRIKELVDLILHHDMCYHVNDAPEILDSEYDALVKELRKLEKKYPHLVTKRSATQRVGMLANTPFEKVKHTTPMLSLNNAFDDEDMAKFHAMVLSGIKNDPFGKAASLVTKFPMYTCEPKYDGLSIDLRYRLDKGEMRFYQAITRGDGDVGEDVTHSVKYIINIPHVIPTKHLTSIDVRGEIVMSFADFERVNELLRSRGEKELANPRNAAAGGVRTLNTNTVKERNLQFYAYGIGDYQATVDKFLPSEYHVLLDLLTDWGFTTQSDLRKRANTMGEVDGYIAHLKEMRPNLPFAIDGAVVKVNSIAIQAVLGYISRAPRFAIAFKYPPEEARTIVTAIDLQIGKSGAATPVARLEAVYVGGVVVTNATLHNETWIKEKDIRVGDEVIVCRAGDVVPAIMRSVPEARTRLNTFEYVMPTKCNCGGALHKEEKEKVWRCTAGRRCPDQLVGFFIHAFSRDALNIEGLGDVTIEEMVRKQMLVNLFDIYHLTDDDLRRLDDTGDTTVRNLRDAINASRKTTMARVLYAMGIRHVGKSTSAVLAKHFVTMTGLMKGTDNVMALKTIKDIGDKTAMALHRYLGDVDQAKEIMELMEELEIEIPVLTKSITPKDLVGKTFVITGSFIHHSREEMKEIIEDRGGKVSSGVSKKTDFIIVGAEPGKSKLKAAEDCGVPRLEDLPPVVLEE